MRAHGHTLMKTRLKLRLILVSNIYFFSLIRQTAEFLLKYWNQHARMAINLQIRKDCSAANFPWLFLELWHTRARLFSSTQTHKNTFLKVSDYTKDVVLIVQDTKTSKNNNG